MTQGEEVDHTNLFAEQFLIVLVRAFLNDWAWLKAYLSYDADDLMYLLEWWQHLLTLVSVCRLSFPEAVK
ncbi:hypothetical protein KFK09_016880 [Dendrobium nobile]|uniref:Uncharacterized protein n=1 Tax=Dendrobium nobile TaxID=94219 RepID=A0A8T3B5X9_DENNO|nr:hypothetical protein KFK09_016880 [Dendrobium nobile]